MRTSLGSFFKYSSPNCPEHTDLLSENNKECAKAQSLATIYIFARVCIIGSLVPFVQ